MQQMIQDICWAFVLDWRQVFFKYCLIFKVDAVILQQMQQMQQMERIEQIVL